ncbi:MAG: TauD/TfdA family dioxygenase [Gammaproteobacteria bacterium]|nr:TauD/TfdA family dioxygenase [Gammaproteobacteria bacterium]
MNGPFSLTDTSAYQYWRKAKLDSYPIQASHLKVDVSNPYAICGREKSAITENLRKYNLSIYSISGHQDKTLVAELGNQFGMSRLDSNLCADEDSITSLQVIEGGRQKGYIPYSNRPLNWHTDGYYNTGSAQIRGMILHCVQDAAEGGDNFLLDHEMAYLLMRDEDPRMIKAMMAADAMTIPANEEAGEEIRPAQTGPVFSQDSSGNLHMRYTARKRNIEWKQDAATLDAVAFLEALLASESRYIFRYHLRPGEGLICNNVLHSRTTFTEDDEHKRLLYRARYYDRASDTDLKIEEG